MPDRYQQIVDAGRALLVDDPRAGLSVRSVAERAGVGASTLRHHFPTQRELHEAIYGAFYDTKIDDLRIRDTSIAPRDRLRECLMQLLPPAQPATLPLDGWVTAITSAFGSSASPEARTAWTASVIHTRHQIVQWLETLALEGAVAAGTEERSARFLIVALDGLSLARVIPASRLEPDAEAAVLDDAISAALRYP